jgi:transposase
MFELNAGRTVYLHRDAIDFRKSINGLASLVEHGLELNAFEQAVFVFGNRRMDRIKILRWDRNGFWLLKKRLEDARFERPRHDSAVVRHTLQQLHWLLDGIDLCATCVAAAPSSQRICIRPPSVSIT